MAQIHDVTMSAWAPDGGHGLPWMRGDVSRLRYPTDWRSSQGMNWLNIPGAVITSPQHLQATVDQHGIWLRLMVYCVAQENGGHIANCQEWTDALWQRAAGVTANQVKAKSPLWHWESINCLSVADYPTYQESKCRKNRIAGKKGGRPSKAHEARIDAAQEPTPAKRNGNHG